MGTNYYIVKKASDEEKKHFQNMLDKETYEDLCDALNQFISSHKIHVGKSSCGWKFLFDANNFKYFDRSVDSVWKWIKENGDDLYDEYNRHVTYEEFRKMVENKQDGWDYLTYQLEEKIQDPYLTVSDYYIGDLRFSSHTDFS